MEKIDDDDVGDRRHLINVTADTDEYIIYFNYIFKMLSYFLILYYFRYESQLKSRLSPPDKWKESEETKKSRIMKTIL